MFNIQEFIRAKRDGHILSSDDMGVFIAGIKDNTISDAQIAAFCMAVVLRGMNRDETAALTRAMAHSGTVLQWQDLNGPVIDKHSTGGVGDKISLMLAPMAASCGLYVPMIAGRGLGHTGGTIDKLDVIPGYRTDLSIAEFQKTVRKLGCAIIGQTAEFAPADKRIYAVRDVTATVESIPLITASILSKKLAAGLEGLVIDMKFGNGAFMETMDKAQELADGMTAIARKAGLPLKAVLTDMNQVLGFSAGNAVEIREAIDYLTGAAREPRMHEITLTLVAEMLILGRKASSLDEGKIIAQQVLDNGKAAEVFSQMVAAQGGPKDLMQKPEQHLPAAPIQVDVLADRDGVLTTMDTRAIGMLLVNLKAGRARVGDSIDPAIGITHVMSLGTVCESGKTALARFHLREAASKDIAIQSYLNNLTIK